VETVQQSPATQASLEGLIETELLNVESLHPGGLELTEGLAELCEVRSGSDVLELACGTGESACFLAERRGARVVGLDASPRMIRRAEEKARARGLGVAFRQADAHHLPFPDAAFDVAICECTLCIFDKEQVLREMVRVVRPGGRVGMHDLCWREDTPEDLKRTLAEIEGERPETLEGWQRLFARAGLANVRAVDKSPLIHRWMKESRKQLGLIGQLRLGWKVIRRWGIRGLRRILRSERVLSSKQVGYGIVVGTRR
jgi:SAM-dependent methyltransferase